MKSLSFLRFFNIFLKNSGKPCRFLRFCSWLFKKHAKTNRFLWFLICDFRKSWYFGRRVQKMLRHTSLVIQKPLKNQWFSWFFEIVIFKNNEKTKRILRCCCVTRGWLFKKHTYFWCFFDTFDFMKSKNRDLRNARATAHRWRQTSVMKSELTCTLF